MAQIHVSVAEKDDLRRILTDPANQAIVSYFYDSPANTASFGDLSTFLVEELPGERDASVILHHKCLPELSYFGLLAYDAERSTVEWLRPDVLQAWQDCVDQFDVELQNL